jgi:hypothetical protein
MTKKNELLDEPTPDISMYQQNTDEAVKPKKKTKERPKSERISLPKTKLLGSEHPIEFAKDLKLLLVDINCQPKEKRVTQGELIEIAFYQLRQKLTGEAPPKWVENIKKLER